MRILGLDIGEKNIGVAVSDPSGLIAQGLDVIERKNWKKDLQRIRHFLKEYKVKEIVLGLPRNMDGTLGIKAREILEFKEKIDKAVDVKVTTWDERLTTVAAQRTLLEADVSRKGRKKVIDKLAAVFILEGYLRYKQRTTDKGKDV
ncbi:MAG: Holliday junction resolvase RuvX [Firmicutes bacterium]|nr:Holliday junction resolvase RuvX [Bacillota bacterium]